MLVIEKDALMRLFLCLLVFAGYQPTFAANPDSSCLNTLPELQYDEIAVVKYIHDGDTLKLRDGRKVRLIGINTPELARDNKTEEAYAREAKNTLSTLFREDKSIGLIFGSDKKDHYGRLLAHVFSANKHNTQAALLRQGYAFAITVPPNTQFANCYLALEHQARCDGQGLWKDTQIIRAKSLNKTHLSYHLVQGKVQSIRVNKKGIWLNLDNKLTVGIRPDNRKLFDIKTINDMLDQSIIVRGWLNNSKKSTPFYMRIRHPLSIQLASTYACS